MSFPIFDVFLLRKNVGLEMNILIYVGIIWIQMQYMVLLSNGNNNFSDTLILLAHGLLWKNALPLRKCIMRTEQESTRKK